MTDEKTDSRPIIKLAIVGGGAAGYFAAINAAEKNPNIQATIFEATTKPLVKVRISGGGRCNVTHNCFDVKKLVSHYPRGHRELLGPFTRFQPQNTVEWFATRGVPLKTEEDGRMFPTTDNSETIASCLESAAREAGVVVRTATAVKQVRANNLSQFDITLKDGTVETFDKLILTCGGSTEGHALAQSLGHGIVPPCPSLFTFKVDSTLIRDLSGLSFPTVHLKLQCTDHAVLEQTGPLLITHWGLSGPAVLKLSAWGARPLHETKYQADLMINWIGSMKTDPCIELLTDFKARNLKKQIDTVSPIPMPSRFWTRLIETNNMPLQKIWADISKQEITRLSESITRTRLKISGKGVFKEEFVTCGGVKLNQVDFKTMQSRICPGLYFAGEILDIDGITGGFNFQNAWTTSWIAASHLASHS